MATTGELRAIIELLELVDIGDAASYLGEESMVGSAYENDSTLEEQGNLVAHANECCCVSCQILRS